MRNLWSRLRILTLAPGLSGVVLAQGGGGPTLRPGGAEGPPVIGAWFWSDEVLEPDGYRAFPDAAAAHAPYTLLSTSCRRLEVVEPRMHDQIGKAVRHADSLGPGIAPEADIRLAARQAFRARYPDEQQEELVLRMVRFPGDGPAEVVFEGSDTTSNQIGLAPRSGMPCTPTMIAACSTPSPCRPRPSSGTLGHFGVSAFQLVSVSSSPFPPDPGAAR